MDKPNIINHINTYNDLEKKKKKVKGIELGFQFLEKLFKELKNLESLSLDLSRSDITFINVFDYKEGKFLSLKVSLSLFNEHLQFFYRQFIDEYYFSTFSWYQEFSSTVKIILIKEFNYDSMDAMNLMVRLVSNCFLIFSKGVNEYDYDELVDYLKKIFYSVGVTEKESEKLATTIIGGLHENGLILSLNKVFSFRISKKICLSDRYMDIIFHLSSFFIARVASKNDNKPEYDPKKLLSHLLEFIEKYDHNWNSKPQVEQLRPFLLDNHAELINELSDYYVLGLNFKLIEKVPDHVKDVACSYYYNKVLLNEYCLQLIIISCFDFFTVKSNSKNILYRYYSDGF